VKTAIKRYENSSSQCVFRTDSVSKKTCGFLSFRFKNTKLFRPKAENGIFRHLCGKKRNKSGGGKTFSEFLGIKAFTVSLAVIPDGADRHRGLRLPQKGRHVRRPDRLPQGLIPPLSFLFLSLKTIVFDRIQ
jgi:hypothetical protein